MSGPYTLVPITEKHKELLKNADENIRKFYELVGELKL